MAERADTPHSDEFCCIRNAMKQDVLADSGYHAASWKRLAHHLVSSNRQWRYWALGALIWKAEVGKKDPSQKKERDKG